MDTEELSRQDSHYIGVTDSELFAWIYHYTLSRIQHIGK